MVLEMALSIVSVLPTADSGGHEGQLRGAAGVQM